MSRTIKAERMRWLFAIAFWSATLLSVVMATLPHPPRVPGDPPDKVQHMMAFAVMAGLGSLAWPRISRVRILSALAILGALIEVVQMIPRLHRDSDWRDWVADVVASGVVIGLVMIWRRRASRSGRQGGLEGEARSGAER